jgi:hypothetical protein
MRWADKAIAFIKKVMQPFLPGSVGLRNNIVIKMISV